MTVRWLMGDCRVTLPTLDAESVQACVTSPPYYGLRDYKLPPLVWGGDAAHKHDFAVENARIQSLRNGQGAHGLERHGVDRKSPALDAVFEQHRQLVQVGSCACGAWLGSLG